MAKFTLRQLVCVISICMSLGLALAEESAPEPAPGVPEPAPEPEEVEPMKTSFEWAIYVIIMIIITLSVFFEQLKDWAEDEAGPDMEKILAQMFSELTILGFLGLITFLVVKANWLSQLSDSMFGIEDALEDILETLHFSIFFIMVTFILEIVVVILAGQKNIRRWKAMEDKKMLHLDLAKKTQSLTAPRKVTDMMDTIIGVAAAPRETIRGQKMQDVLASVAKEGLDGLDDARNMAHGTANMFSSAANRVHNSLASAAGLSSLTDVDDAVQAQLDEFDKEKERREAEFRKLFTAADEEEYNLLKLRFSRRVQYDAKPKHLKDMVKYPNFPLSKYFQLHQRRVMEDLAELEPSIWLFMMGCVCIMRAGLLLPVQYRLVMFICFEGFVFLFAWIVKQKLRAACGKLLPGKVNEVEIPMDHAEQAEVPRDSIESGAHWHRDKWHDLARSSKMIIPDPVENPDDPRFQTHYRCTICNSLYRPEYHHGKFLFAENPRHRLPAYWRCNQTYYNHKLKKVVVCDAKEARYDTGPGICSDDISAFTPLYLQVQAGGRGSSATTADRSSTSYRVGDTVEVAVDGHGLETSKKKKISKVKVVHVEDTTGASLLVEYEGDDGNLIKKWVPKWGEWQDNGTWDPKMPNSGETSVWERCVRYSPFRPEYVELTNPFCSPVTTSGGGKVMGKCGCVRRVQSGKGAPGSRYNTLFWLLPWGNTDMSWPRADYVELPNKFKRGEPMYDQYPPSKQMINYLTTVMLVNATYVALFGTMVAPQMWEANFHLAFRITMLVAGTLAPLIIITKFLPPAISDFIKITCIEDFTDYPLIDETIMAKKTEEAVRFLKTMQGLVMQINVFRAFEAAGGEASKEVIKKLDPNTEKGRQFVRDLEHCWLAYDVDNSGDVDYAEFELIILALEPVDRLPEVDPDDPDNPEQLAKIAKADRKAQAKLAKRQGMARRVFDECDADGNAIVTKKEFIEFMLNHYIECNEEENVEAIFKMINDIGEDAEEDMLYDAAAARNSDSGSGSGSSSEESFDEEDHITFEELRTFIEKMPASCFPGGAKPSTDDVREIIRAADQNEDDEISIEEFLDLIHKYEGVLT